MGYKYRNGSTPEHVDSSQSDPTNPHTGLSISASDSTGKKKPSMNTSDSLDKYEKKAYDAAGKGDVKGTEAASRKYAKFDDDYVASHAKGDINRVKANQDLINKKGGYEAGRDPKMSSNSGFMYGAETMDTSEVNNMARQKAASNAKKEKLDNIKARAKP